MSEKVYIIILNWNSWRDTIECLESVLRLDYDNYQVIVCDNASSDDSLNCICQWASGNITAPVANSALAYMTMPPFRKPVTVRSFTSPPREKVHDQEKPSIWLIETGGNFGFAGGCNVGIRMALREGDCSYVWLLNNDTVVTPQSLSELVGAFNSEPSIGMAGSTIYRYYDPQIIQDYGGQGYNKWIARISKPSANDIPRKMAYVCGCSMLVKSDLIHDIGLMGEQYFLYYEEIDWAVRSRGKYTLGYAPNSIIYHKEGASTGANSARSKGSFLAERYSFRNRILFTRKYHPWMIPSVLAGVVLAVLFRAASGDLKRAKNALLSAIEGLRL